MPDLPQQQTNPLPAQASLILRISNNRHTVAMSALALAMWYAGAAQSNGAVYILAFTLTAMAGLSYFHARTNLRHLRIQPGEARVHPRTGRGVLPFTLIATGAKVSRGIEIAAEGASAPVFVDRLESDRPFHSELQFQALRLEPATPVMLVARSLYPLGFFTAEIRVPVFARQKAHPIPAGDLPLPAPEKTPVKSSQSAAGKIGSQIRGGDDFAGVRAWQPGDSPRHVDWKAVARDRPLLTKQWAGDESAHVILNWDRLSLTADARGRQMAKWIQQCEAGGIRYGMRLPGKRIAPGIGPAHSRRCLDALADLTPARTESSGSTKQRSIPFLHELTPPPSGIPMMLLALALALTLPPLVGEVSLMAMALLLAALSYRITPLFKGVSHAVRTLFVVLGTALVIATETELRSMESATAVLLVFLGGKVLESRAPRDFQVLAVLGWFLCMCGLSFEQSLFWSLYTFAVFLFIAAIVVRFRQGSRGLTKSARTVFGMAVQALPFVAVLFLFLPRGAEDWVARLARRQSGQSGLSSQLRPGSIARIALSNELAFRVQLPDGRQPDFRDRYWRCLVLWDCRGFEWNQGAALAEGRPAPGKTGRTFRQIITLEPHGGVWLPGLDRPAYMLGVRGGVAADADDTFRAGELLDSVMRYEVVSRTNPSPSPISQLQRAIALTAPSNISGEVENLARSFRRSETDSDSAVVKAALDYFRTQGFKYTLEPGTYGAEGLADFLFRRRSGFCEHFATAFATLMRLADVPARVVVGYLGGEYSDRGDYWIVRQCDAHAWTEVWLKETGWTRFDPTAALVPERLTTDLETFLAGGLGSDFALRRGTLWWQMWSEARLFWDGLNYQWYNQIVTADKEAQRLTLESLGLDGLRWPALVISLLACIGLMAAAVIIWLRRPAAHPEPAVREWQKLCRRLARSGMVRQPGEGAGTFAQRVAADFPAAAPAILSISAIYNELRFGPQGSRRLKELRAAIRQFTPLLKHGGREDVSYRTQASAR